MLTFHDLLARFPEPKRVGKEWRTLCPAHPDKSPSLDIAEGDHSLAVFTCRTHHCSAADILRAVGLEWADVLPERHIPSQNGHVAPWDMIHEYRDLAGVLHNRVLRRGTGKDKIIRPQRPSDDALTLDGVERIPYQLHRMPGHRRVVVVEGEKCADCLWADGIPATTNVSGANQWHESDSLHLKQAGVTELLILPDNNGVGHTHAARVQAMSLKVGLAARIIALPGVAPEKDVVDWLEDHSLSELVALLDTPIPKPRAVKLVPASEISVRPVRWMWKDRIALGTLCLLAGREGIGKSILAYTMAADLTRGRMEGEHFGHPKSVIVAATEDSWAHTIVPRLMGADADLDRIFRVDVHTLDGADVPLSLPIDLAELQRAIVEADAALVLLDPLLSRLDSALDTHKDANVRVALEPLVALGDATGASLLGLIHLNKSASTDMLTLMMGSRAFAAVARSVLFAMEDPDDKTRRLLGQAKNNLGRSDLPTRTFSIHGGHVATTDEGEVWTGVLAWGEDTAKTVSEALQSAKDEASGDSTAVNEAAEWLLDYMTQEGGDCDSAKVKQSAQRNGHAARTLTRARAKIGVTTFSHGFPKRTNWILPKPPSDELDDE